MQSLCHAPAIDPEAERPSRAVPIIDAMTSVAIPVITALAIVLAGCTMPRKAPTDDEAREAATPSVEAAASAAAAARIDMGPAPGPDAQPPAAPPADPAVTPPAPLHRPPPAYPAALQDGGGEGRVIARFIVDVRGVPETVRIVQSSDPLFSDAVTQAVRAWRYVPARDAAGRAVPADVRATFQFRLED